MALRFKVNSSATGLWASHPTPLTPGSVVPITLADGSSVQATLVGGELFEGTLTATFEVPDGTRLGRIINPLEQPDLSYLDEDYGD